MAQFIPGQTVGEVKATEPTLDVLVDQTHPLKVGKYVFQLIVTDDSGNDSSAATVTIVVVDQVKPTAVVEVINAAGERLATPTVQIPFGQKFTLTGEHSTDVGGVVAGYRWTLQT